MRTRLNARVVWLQGFSPQDRWCRSQAELPLHGAPLYCLRTSLTQVIETRRFQRACACGCPIGTYFPVSCVTQWHTWHILNLCEASVQRILIVLCSGLEPAGRSRPGRCDPNKPEISATGPDFICPSKQNTVVRHLNLHVSKNSMYPVMMQECGAVSQYL